MCIKFDTNHHFFYAADTLGFTTYPPAYLSPQASGNNLLIGANFASAASGFDDKTAIMNVKILLSFPFSGNKQSNSPFTALQLQSDPTNFSVSFVLQHAIPLSQQLEYYKEYQAKLTQVAGAQKAASILKDGLYLLSAGSSDFFQNYYVNPFLYKVYTPDQYSAYLVGIFTNFVKVRNR